VFASLGRHGSFDAPFVLALGADSPVVASNGSGFVVVYRRGASCESVALDHDDVAPAVPLEDGATGPCTGPAIASDGVRYVAGWRAGPTYDEPVRAAVGDGVIWSTPATLSSDASYDANLDVAARDGVYGVAFDSDGGVLFRSSADAGATFGSSKVVDEWGAAEGPRVAAGPAGFALVWTSYTKVYGSVSSGGVFPWSPTTVRSDPNSCGSPAITAGPGGFMSAFDCWTPFVAEWEAGWKPATALASTPSDGIRLAGSPRGYAVLYRERTPAANLRGGTRVDGVWRLDTVRPHVEKGPALAWDGEAHVVGWTELGAVDLGADRVLVRRGL
jgi:hypothetical protein